MMVLDYHEKNLAKKLEREPKEVELAEVEKVWDEIEKNENERVEKPAMSAWVKGYMCRHQDCRHDQRIVLEKIISTKEEKLQNFRDGHE